MAERPAAVLLVLAPSGQRSRVPLDAMPFTIGRQSGNSLVLRDNRTSRNHSRIVFENGKYVIEDLNSRHGTWVNGKQVARHVLQNSDRIEFGVRDSYQLTFSVEKQDIQRLLEQFGSSSRSVVEDHGADNLVKLRSLVEVARALQNSLSTKEVLTAVVDAALAVTGCERGFLLLRPEGDKNADLDVAVARDSAGGELEADELRVPRHRQSPRRPARLAFHGLGPAMERATLPTARRLRPQ